MKFWGKADGENGTWHPLVYHMLDVAAVAVAYCSANPVFLIIHEFIEICPWRV